jgi:preprotein translocase subunit SecE
LAQEVKKMARTGVAEFIKQVRQEAQKVTWSTKKETITSTIVVLVMIFIASIFFLIVDSVILKLTQLVMGF